MAAHPDSPIGVFDSGIGGLSILRALREELPQESFVYIADSGNAPYGERDAQHVVVRSLTIADYLKRQHHIKALVVACNTATALAIAALRERYPPLPIIGVEPALKPAALQSRTGHIGVMATRGTLNSPKFEALINSLPASVQVSQQACDGLADAIERKDAAQIELLCQQALDGLGSFGTGVGQIDQLVMGCTHYPFATAVLRYRLGPATALLESGAPVARQTRRLLQAQNAISQGGKAQLAWIATGYPERLAAACRDWLQIDAPVTLLPLPQSFVTQRNE